jgi:hypothetical protein
MSWLISLILKALASFGLNWFRDKRSNENAQELGAERAADETERIIARTADERSQVDIGDGSPADLVKRLRDAAKAAGGSAVNGDSK